MAKRRSNLDLIGRWLWFVALPWLLLAIPRLIYVIWRLAFRAQEKQAKIEARSKDFYRSRAWQTARVKCFERNKQANGGHLRCELCGRLEIHGVTAWHCHHVKSRSKWPELALDPDNLAACCDDCNFGMGNRYEDLALNRCRRKAA